jgi:hypothetical protein
MLKRESKWSIVGVALAALLMRRSDVAREEGEPAGTVALPGVELKAP